MVQTRSSKRRRTEDQMGPSEKTAPLLPPARIPSDLVGDPAMGNPDGQKTRTDQRQGGMVGTPVESIPPVGKRKDNLPLPDCEGRKLPLVGPIEASMDYNLLPAGYSTLLKVVESTATKYFKPTPWDKLKPDDQSKLSRWTPDARLLIESHRGYALIFQAWIWHVIEEGVFSANPKTKWQDQSDEYEPVKLLSQFIDIIQKAKDGIKNDTTGPSKSRDYSLWHIPEYNNWRSVSAELALKGCPDELPVDPIYVANLLDSNFSYLAERSHTVRGVSFGEQQALIGIAVAGIEACLFICRVKARFVWTDPLTEQHEDKYEDEDEDEDAALYGFPFTNKEDTKREIRGYYKGGTFVNTRMYARRRHVREVGEEGAVWQHDRDNEEEHAEWQRAAEGKPVQLVVSPGMVSRGRMVLENYQSVPGDWHLTCWLQHINVLLPDTFEPPIEPATTEDGEFVPAI